MKTTSLIHSCVLLLTSLALDAQPSHAYELNNSYADTYGGSAMIPNGGTLTSSGYLFEMGEGPNVSNVIDPNTYSIVMRFTPHYVDSWAKVLDFKGRTVDGGVYISGGDFYFSNSDFSISGGAPSVFTQDVPVTVCITRDGATKEVQGFADGILHWTFIDTGDEGTFTGPGNIINLFIDDLFVFNGNCCLENTNGSLDYFRIYDYVITDPTIINPSCGNSDSDCDGVSSDCDVCPGGDDNGPCNVTTLPPLGILPSNWLCSNNNNSEKILICHQGTTLCVSESSANTHLAHGDFLGPCYSCSAYSIPESPMGETEQEADKLVISPNPAYDAIQVDVLENSNTDRQIIIYDQLGKVLLTQKLEPEETFIHLNLDQRRFAPGIYYVTMITDHKEQSKRLILGQ